MAFVPSSKRSRRTRTKLEEDRYNLATKMNFTFGEMLTDKVNTGKFDHVDESTGLIVIIDAFKREQRIPPERAQKVQKSPKTPAK